MAATFLQIHLLGAENWSLHWCSPQPTALEYLYQKIVLSYLGPRGLSQRQPQHDSSGWTWITALPNCMATFCLQKNWKVFTWFQMLLTGDTQKITVGENMSSTGTISLLPAAPILRSSIKQSFKFHLETQPQRPTTLRSTVDVSTSKPCCIAGFEFCQNHPPPGSLPTTDVVSCEKASKNNCTQREFKMATKVFPFYQKIMQ